MPRLDHLSLPVHDWQGSRDQTCAFANAGVLGYGAELCDPNGYMLRPWDQKSMKEKGG
jgi:hypothetical protein